MVTMHETSCVTFMTCVEFPMNGIGRCYYENCQCKNKIFSYRVSSFIIISVMTSYNNKRTQDWGILQFLFGFIKNSKQWLNTE